jgi:hypothetical protein
MRRLLAVAGVALALAACSSGQDPGLDETPTTRAGGSTPAPQLLEPCPPGGPDERSPAAGCVDEDGNVLH